MPDPLFTHLSRRGFLAASTAAGLTATTGMASPPSALRTAVIGCGDGGTRVAEALRTSPSMFRLAALSDANTDRLHALAGKFGVAADPDWARAVARSDVDAVVIATPDHRHVEMALAALDAGKHVYLLPPASRTAAEAQTLYTRAAKSDQLLYVGMEAGPVALWTAAADQLRHRRGAPRWIQASCPPVPPEMLAHWTRDRACSMGAAAHRLFSMLYPLQYYFDLDAPTRVTVLGGVFDGPADLTSDALTCTVRYNGGMTVVLTCAPGHTHQQPAIIRGAWPAVELAWTPDAFNVSRLDLHAFGQELCSGHPTSAGRLQAACTAQVALSGALEASPFDGAPRGHRPGFGLENGNVA